MPLLVVDGVFLAWDGSVSPHTSFVQVLSQFRSMYESRSNLEEIYVMGHRLIAFYTEALPRHKDYRSIDPSISTLREKTINDLDWIRKRLDVISLRIDEVQLNLHIQRQEQTETAEVVTSTTTVKQSCNTTADQQETQWESFSGWLADFSSNEESLRPKTDEASMQEPAVTRRRLPLEPEHADDPGDILDLESEDETDVESDCDSLSDVDSDERAVVHFQFTDEEGYDSSFLRVIASEEVEYEEDSEAVDSWAQDDESLESLAEHAPVAARTIVYSQAEMLGDLLNRVKQDPLLQSAMNKLMSESSDFSSGDEVENVDPATSFCSESKDTTATTLCSYPSFDEPPDDEKAEDITSSPQDVMEFDNHTSCRHSPQKDDVVSFSDEEIVPIYLPGLRI